MTDDDAALMAEIRDGSDRAFNVLIDRRQQAVRAFLYRLLGDAADADDMAQETFLEAWTHARSYRGQADVRSWLCGIAWRKAKGAQRSWARRRTVMPPTVPPHRRLRSRARPWRIGWPSGRRS